MTHLKIQPAGQVPLSNSGRKPVIKVVGGDTWRVSLNLYNPANPAEAANPDNTTVTVKLADTQFDEPIWVGEWLNGVEPDDKRKDLCYLVVPKNITQSLRRGNYMFSVRVADLLKTRIETEAEGSFLVEYKVTSDQHSIPYKDGTSGAAGGSGGGSLDYVESINGKTGKVSLSAVDIGAATSAQGAKADSAIQAVKVNGAVITPDEDKSVDVPVPVTSVNSKTGAVSLDANDVGALSHTGDQTLSNGSLTIEKDDQDGGIWLKIKRGNESGITLHFSYISFNGNTFDLPSSSGVLALLSDIAVKSVNSKTGDVQLDASDVGAVATSDVVAPDANAEPGKVADAKATGDALTYTKEWVEALTPNDRGSGKTHITFKPTGFGARSNFRLKSFTIMSSDVAARLPSQPVYAKVIDPEATLHVKAVSHPVSVTETNTNYTFVFDESEELIYNKQYKMIFSSGADDGSPLLIFGVRVYNATEDQDIYYADFPRMKPITRWVYSYNSLVTGLNDELDSRVPTTRTINNKELSADISLSASDVNAATSAQGAKADSAIQTVKLNGSPLTPDANGAVDVPALPLTGGMITGDLTITTALWLQYLNSSEFGGDFFRFKRFDDATDEPCDVMRREDLAGLAPLASPAFTGTPTAPTPNEQSADTQIATKKYVDDAVAGGGGGNLDYVMRVDPETGGIYYTTPDTNA